MGAHRLPAGPRIEARHTPEPNTGCWLWTGTVLRHGYGQICVDGGRDLAHRASWRHFRGAIAEGLWVLHRCDTPACINPDHLFLGTHQDNVDDKVSKGRQPRMACAPKRPATGARNAAHTRPDRRPRGVTQGSAKLTDELVRQIRDARARGVPQREVARQFGTSQGNVQRIATRRAWTHVP